MAATRLFRPLLLSSLALTLSVGCTRAYLQNEGRYEFMAMEVLRDDCAMLSSPEALWGGTLQISGEVVRMDYELLHLHLVGSFLDGGPDDEDAFSMDGSVTNASLTANGQQCIVDQVTMHLDGTTLCATRFDGVMRVRYHPRLYQPECACELWVRYQAVQDGSSCAPAR
ncbi:hypothetical protein [Archangium lipolyticum]|uniref:hypothetical protein n=1 Tax=Archangium lipolyticum TaxID=2970465 RepID=UPI002149EA19|nr:hypothetical protein [Archangium lipolyticum]